ncbi:hypothetical protein CTAYLR_004708 [Chrysophaeum taylorii]|uniref:ADP-ribosylglycohydrolase family protein n=1 Tax=Chrysophaeum taylorii TaxID=2483200 RepID=A0AAD7XHI6_9STRA|nr:hypothetical protein CTAYLR_004708 [Chrysophaeum taylorii]
MSREDRVRGALWSFFAGDALAAPTHWYYGGRAQVARDYGKIVDYTKPVLELPGSIMAKSNTDGAGRGSYNPRKKTIIGDVINHGKKPYWDPARSYHYHCTLEAGENTLEAQLARVLMRSIASSGRFDPNDFRKSYVDFMTTPGTHDDAYASTCHRMFFANLVHRKLRPEECPDNDRHNVDTMDGLVLPTIAAIAEAYAAPDESPASRDLARRAAAETVRVTRNSPALENAAGALSDILFDLVVGKETDPRKAVQATYRIFPGDVDPMVACYLSESFPSTLQMAVTYSTDVWTALLANANAGGENVHRGSVLGAILGAGAGASKLPRRLVDGLAAKPNLETEIDTLLRALERRRGDPKG